MAITFYDYPRAPSPRRARIVLAEKQIPHQTIVVDLAADEQRAGAYAAVNPRLTVPALVLDDGTTLTDNAGIAAWAEAAYPDPPLLGTTPIEKAEVASWTHRVEFECFAAIAEAMRNSAAAMRDRALPGPEDYPQIPELAARGRARLSHFLDRFDRHLAHRRFVATDRFTVADIAAVVAVDFARVVGVKPVESHPAIRDWREGLSGRPSLSL